MDVLCFVTAEPVWLRVMEAGDGDEALRALPDWPPTGGGAAEEEWEGRNGGQGVPSPDPAMPDRQPNGHRELSPEEDEGVKEKVADFVSHTTFHGLDQIITGNTFAKVFWSLVLLFVIVIVTLQLRSLIVFFLQNPTLTSIAVVFPDQGLAFPNITICILVKFNASRLRSSFPAMNGLTAEFATASFFSAFSTTLMDVGYFHHHGYNVSTLQGNLDRELENGSFTDFVEEVSFECGPQFLYCWFENGQLVPCCRRGRDQPVKVRRFLLHSGPCYVFEVSKRQRLPGPVGGVGFAYWYPNAHLFPSVFNSYDEHGGGAAEEEWEGRNGGQGVPSPDPAMPDRQPNGHRELSPEEDEGVKEKVADFVSHTTFHGLDQIITGNTFAKVFWSLVLLFVIVIVTLQLRSLIVFFLQNPTLTSIAVVFPDQGLAFPNITICILVKFNASRLRSSFPAMNGLTAEFATASFFSAFSTTLMDVGYFHHHGYNVSTLQGNLDRELENGSFTDFVEEVSFECGPQFLYCWFENGQLVPCCRRGRDQPVKVRRFLLHSGPCYVFEVSKRQRLPGPVGGVGFAYWYPNAHLFPSVFNSYDEHGVHLYTSPEEAMLEKNPISLQVGTHAHVSLEATRTTRLARDQLGRTTCVPQTLEFFDNYTYPACQVECLLKIMLKSCGCVGQSSYSLVPKEKVCSPSAAFRCYKSLAHNFTSILIACRLEKCTEACQYWSYRPAVTAGKVFNPVISEQMTRYWRLPASNQSRPENSLILADVYFPDIQYTDVEQQPAVTIESFVSNIGGAMGLWTGASIITWIHLFYFCCASCNLRRQKRRERRKREERESLERTATESQTQDSLLLQATPNKANNCADSSLV